MTAAIQFWLAKQITDVGILLGVVLLIALWFGFLYGMAIFSDWRLRRVYNRKGGP